MAKEMLINVSEGEECRIALVEDGKLEELYMERTSSTSHVGNIYKGRVTNVEPSIQAAFIDFGLGRNGFLHISDLMPSYFGGGKDFQETVGRKLARRDRPPIQRCLRRGDDIIVQIIKEGIGTKGPTLTTYLSIPGRILVMMPGMGKMGVSRKIEDEEERRRLRQILDSLKPPKDVGFIIRTAGVGKSKTEIQRDLTYLTRLWTSFVKSRDSGPGPTELYTEGDLVTRTVRDVFTTDIDRIVIDHKEVAKRVKDVIKLANPRTRNKVDLYEETVPLFHKYGIEREIEQMYSRHVPLPSGGSLVIDSTEAIVAIDVNSGKFRDHSDAETTAFKTDMEAADEIPRQLRLRDLGGVIICDFIDLRYERHRHELETRLHENFQKDRAKTKVLRMSQFGIIELTRQRMRPSLKRSIYFDCPHCKGAGLVKTRESMSLDVMRRLAIAINDLKVARIELTVNPEVDFHLQNKKREQISTLEQRFKKRVIIRSDSKLGLDEMKLDLFDARDAIVILEELGLSAPAVPHTTQLGTRPAQPAPDQRRGGRRDDRRPQRQAPPRSGGDDDERDDRSDIDDVEDQIDQREEDMDQEPGDAAEPMSLPAPQDKTGANLPAAQSRSRGEPIGDAPRGFDDGQDQPQHSRHRRGRRGGRNRGGQNQNQNQNRQGFTPNNQRQQPPVAARDADFDENQHDDREINAPPPENSSPQFVGEIMEEADEQPGEISGNVREPETDDEPKRRRRRRGGRRRGRGRGQDGPNNDQMNNAPRSQQAPQISSPPRPALPDNSAHAPRAAEAKTLTRTGSADRHLIHDEPVAPQPVSRPKTYRDLDSIPDDFD